MSRVFITGCGIVSPIGTGWTEFSEGLSAGRSGTATVSCFDTAHLPVSLGAEARHRGSVIAPEPRSDRRALFNRMVLDELATAGRLEQYAPERRVLLAGTSIDYFELERYTGSADARENRWQPYSANSCTLFETLAATYGIKGGAMVNVSACVASSQSIGLAFRRVRNRTGMVAIAGGCDSMLNPLHYMGFWKLGALSDWTGDPARCSRPFDRNRRGVVLGEGAAFYTLEQEADADPATILCEIAGYATTSDSYLITDPEPEGRLLTRAALEAINDAGITPDDIDAVHAHGTGTIKNDLAECAAMKRIFGERYRDIPVFSLKAQIGHLIGACGAVEIAAAVYALRHQVALPTINRDTPDPDIDLLIPDRITPARMRCILKLNAAFGGQNTALVLKRYE